MQVRKYADAYQTPPRFINASESGFRSNVQFQSEPRWQIEFRRAHLYCSSAKWQYHYHTTPSALPTRNCSVVKVGCILNMALTTKTDHMRTYQQEMFERSMKSNTIVVVGCFHVSMKPHVNPRCAQDGHRQRQDSCVRLSIFPLSNVSQRDVSAILRIQAELDRTRSDKVYSLMCLMRKTTDEVPPTQRVWFLTPSVHLCEQQQRALQHALPAYRVLLLTGQDNVDKWSDPNVWSAALDHVRVVVSTYAVLADALGHGFVSLASLALIVFDEGKP